MITRASRLNAHRIITALLHAVETGDNGGDQQQDRAKDERKKQTKQGRTKSISPQNGSR